MPWRGLIPCAAASSRAAGRCRGTRGISVPAAVGARALWFVLQSALILATLVLTGALQPGAARLTPVAAVDRHRGGRGLGAIRPVSIGAWGEASPAEQQQGRDQQP